MVNQHPLTFWYRCMVSSSSSGAKLTRLLRILLRFASRAGSFSLSSRLRNICMQTHEGFADTSQTSFKDAYLFVRGPLTLPGVERPCTCDICCRASSRLSVSCQRPEFERAAPAHARRRGMRVCMHWPRHWLGQRRAVHKTQDASSTHKWAHRSTHAELDMRAAPPRTSTWRAVGMQA